MSDSLWAHGLQHTRLPCPSLSPWVCWFTAIDCNSQPLIADSQPLSWWCYLTTSSSAAPFSFCFHLPQLRGSFSVSWLFASGGQSTSASQWPVTNHQLTTGHELGIQEKLEFTVFFFLHVKFLCNACLLKIKWNQFWSLHGRQSDLTSHIRAKISTPFLCWCLVGYGTPKALLSTAN